MLTGYGIDTLNGRNDVSLLTIATYGQVLFLHITLCRLKHKACNLEIRESCGFHLLHETVGDILQTVVLHQLMLQGYDTLQSGEEPNINLGQLLNTLHGITFL